MKKRFQLANLLTARDDTGMIRQFQRLLFITKAMGQNYRGVTRPLGVSGKLRDLDFNKLSPGDLAVTADGRHVMIYLRDGKWIQSDPLAGKVIVGHAERDPISWFTSLVTMHRWAVLE